MVNPHNHRKVTVTFRCRRFDRLIATEGYYRCRLQLIDLEHGLGAGFVFFDPFGVVRPAGQIVLSDLIGWASR